MNEFYWGFTPLLTLFRRQFTHSWSMGKQTSSRLQNMLCRRALHHDRRAAIGDRTRDTRLQIPDANHLTTADSSTLNEWMSVLGDPNCGDKHHVWLAGVRTPGHVVLAPYTVNAVWYYWTNWTRRKTSSKQTNPTKQRINVCQLYS